MGLHREARRLNELGVAGYSRRVLANPLIALGNRLRAPRHQCPCCGWRGARFFRYFGRGYSLVNTVCPDCGSQPRHRALHSLLGRELSRLTPDARILHLASERALESVFGNNAAVRRVRADLRMRDTDVRADATRMPFRTASFALVIASHLLEHIRDDRAALGEIARVMAPGGRAIVAVPMLYDWRNHQTEEYPAPNPRADNHWRTYGRDLTGRIERSGLACVGVEFASLVNEAQFAAYGLKSGAVFIADKPAAAGRALS